MLKVLAAALVAALVALPAATAAKPTLLPPEAAAAASDGPAHAAGLPSVHRISPQEALAAAAAPGAVTQTAPGLSLAQAVGLASQPRRLARASSSLWCWSGTTGMIWGIWPMQEEVYDHTSWCAWYGGAITMRSTSVTTNTMLCSPQGTYTFANAGGVGYAFVAWRIGGYFACPTNVPWITYHYNRWIDLGANDYGAYYTYGSA